MQAKNKDISQAQSKDLMFQSDRFWCHRFESAQHKQKLNSSKFKSTLGLDFLIMQALKLKIAKKTEIVSNQ